MSTLVDEKEWNWAFVLKEENKVIGTGSIGPNAQMEDYWGIGYNFHHDYWHKGYCTEAMKAYIDNFLKFGIILLKESPANKWTFKKR